MNHAKLSISDALTKAWQITLKNFGFTTGLVVILIVLNALEGTLRKDSAIASLLISLIALAVGIGVIKISLLLAKGEKPEYKELYSNFQCFWNYVGTYILYMLLVGVGFIFFILPGIYLLIKYAFVLYVVIDKNVGPFEAFRIAGELTKGHWWDVFGLALISIGILILGVIAAFIGLLWAYPVVLIASAIFYNQLSEHNHSS